jgi:hypothetical protein
VVPAQLGQAAARSSAGRNPTASAPRRLRVDAQRNVDALRHTV